MIASSGAVQAAEGVDGGLYDEVQSQMPAGATLPAIPTGPRSEGTGLEVHGPSLEPGTAAAPWECQTNVSNPTKYTGGYVESRVSLACNVQMLGAVLIGGIQVSGDGFLWVNHNESFVVVSRQNTFGWAIYPKHVGSSNQNLWYYRTLGISWKVWPDGDITWSNNGQWEISAFIRTIC